MLRIELSYPSRENERAVLARYGAIAAEAPAARPVPEAASTAVPDAVMQGARQQVDGIHVADALQDYVLDLAQASREQTQISLGLSTRAALALLRAARVAAGLRGSDYVSPDDVKTVWPWVVPHRLVLSSEALLEGAGEQQLAQRLLDQVAVPR
jgi:MoxR-like ATPase